MTSTITKITAMPALPPHLPDMDMADIRANAHRAAALLKSMGNPLRLMILCQLTEGEKSVGELEQAVPLSQSALSQHLALLRERNLVATRRAGQSIYYSLSGVEVSAILTTLYGLFCAQKADAPVATAHKPRRKAA